MTKLHLLPVNGGAFNCRAADIVELDDSHVLCNDVILPWEFKPNGSKLYVIGNEYGAMGAVWADCEQEAFDELVDADLAGGILIEESDADEETTRLGNACEPADLDNAWIQRVRLDEKQDCRLLVRFAEARGRGANTLDF